MPKAKLSTPSFAATPGSVAQSNGPGSAPAFDVLIVGAGSAGAVLANRLSADPQRRVLLLEAGPNFAPHEYPTAITNPASVASPDYDWHYQSEDAARLGRPIPTPRGRVVGGSSAVNGSVAMRARASDFERWKKRGVEGWSWDVVLAAYKAMENTPFGDDAWHGRSGPFPIRQRLPEENTPSLRAFVVASRALGLPYVNDFNAGEQRGVGEYPLNIVDGVRVNTGIAYLTDVVRRRLNLVIRSGAEVDAVLLEGKRAVGVRLLNGEVVKAGEVILSAGTFGSPAILLRSGLGPAAHLSELGIAPIVDLPVGDRLKDHPFFASVYALKPEVNAMTPPGGAFVWTRSTLAKPEELDLHVSATHYISPAASPTGGAIVLASALTLPESTGTFRLASRDPRVAPRICYNFFAEPRDLERLLEVSQLARRIAATAPFSDMIDHEMVPGPAVASDDALRRAIMATVVAYAHPTSTVPMGASSDPTAVVDAWGKVRDTTGLRVADGSIIPDVLSAATNPTIIMLAERIAARLTL